ncbi:hypothetical protein Tco_0204942 [Tanacetum coccineum]
MVYQKTSYYNINHFTNAKDIWDNVKMILEGSELTKGMTRISNIDEFEHPFAKSKDNSFLYTYVRFIPTNLDHLALVSNASVQKYPTQSSESPQSSNQPSIADNFQLDTGSTSTDNLIESLTNTLALLNQSFKAHLPQMNNQPDPSQKQGNNAKVQDGWSCCSGCSKYVEDNEELVVHSDGSSVRQ